MNVYDFDKTICKGDTETDFLIFEIFHHPINFFKIPSYINAYLKFSFKKISCEEYRERIYSCLKYVKDIDVEVTRFWIKRRKKILNWYLLNQKEDDVIVTATPLFLLTPILESLRIKDCIATDFDVQKRKCNGIFNYGEEKLRRFKLKYNVNDIESFYTDSLKDLPLLKVAKHPYIVKRYKPREFILSK